MADQGVEGGKRRDFTNPSREGRRWLKTILGFYVMDMINTDDYRNIEHQLLDLIQSERRLVLRSKGRP